MRLVHRVQASDPHPTRRDDFACQLRDELRCMTEQLKHANEAAQQLIAEATSLADRVASGENMTRYDVTVPWERRATDRRM
jgi:hypothetical protein